MNKISLLLIIITLVACNGNTKTPKMVALASTAKSFSPMQTDVQASITRGKAIYSEFCITCHLDSGEGVPGAFPPLAKSDWLINKREAAIRAVKYGLKGGITVNGDKYSGMMMPMGLTDEEVTDVMNYITHSWGNTTKKAFTLEEVEAVEK